MNCLEVFQSFLIVYQEGVDWCFFFVQIGDDIPAEDGVIIRVVKISLIVRIDFYKVEGTIFFIDFAKAFRLIFTLFNHFLRFVM